MKKGVHRALHVTAASETRRAMFRPRSAVSEPLTRATAADAAVLELAHPHTERPHDGNLQSRRGVESLPLVMTAAGSRLQVGKHFAVMTCFLAVYSSLCTLY